MAQLPTRPMPVSRDVCPVFLHAFALRTGRRAVWPTVQVSPVPSLRAPAPPGAGPGDGTKASTVPESLPSLLTVLPISLTELGCNPNKQQRDVIAGTQASSQMELGLTLSSTSC